MVEPFFCTEKQNPSKTLLHKQLLHTIVKHAFTCRQDDTCPRNLDQILSLAICPNTSTSMILLRRNIPIWDNGISTTTLPCNNYVQHIVQTIKEDFIYILSPFLSALSGWDTEPRRGHVVACQGETVKYHCTRAQTANLMAADNTCHKKG